MGLGMKGFMMVYVFRVHGFRDCRALGYGFGICFRAKWFTELFCPLWHVRFGPLRMQGRGLWFKVYAGERLTLEKRSLST